MCFLCETRITGLQDIIFLYGVKGDSKKRSSTTQDIFSEIKTPAAEIDACPSPLIAVVHQRI